MKPIHRLARVKCRYSKTVTEQVKLSTCQGLIVDETCVALCAACMLQQHKVRVRNSSCLITSPRKCKKQQLNQLAFLCLIQSKLSNMLSCISQALPNKDLGKFDFRAQASSVQHTGRLRQREAETSQNVPEGLNIVVHKAKCDEIEVSMMKFELYQV